MLTKEIISSI